MRSGSHALLHVEKKWKNEVFYFFNSYENTSCESLKKYEEVSNSLFKYTELWIILIGIVVVELDGYGATTLVLVLPHTQPPWDDYVKSHPKAKPFCNKGWHQLTKVLLIMPSTAVGANVFHLTLTPGSDHSSPPPSLSTTQWTFRKCPHASHGATALQDMSALLIQVGIALTSAFATLHLITAQMQSPLFFILRWDGLTTASLLLSWISSMLMRLQLISM